MKSIYSSVLAIILLLSFASGIFADIKIRQKVSMSGQTFETTKMIKGARQRTEQKSSAGGAMDFMSQVATIEQCDLRRNVYVNDTKKLYFIDPFAEESNSPTPTPTPQTRPTNTQTRRGGTMTITYIVTDTGERKTFFGLQARHLKVLQEMESSADSCSGPNKSKMEIDGWYVDFSAEFNCPMDVPQAPRGQYSKPDCRDRIVVKQSGSTKLGFLLNGTMTFYDASGNVTMSQTTETLELSRSPLAATLFDVPADYKLASSQQDLYSMPSMTDMMRQQQQQPQQNNDENPSMPSGKSRKTVGLNLTFGADAKVNQAEISQYLQTKLRENNLNARVGTSGDYVLNVEIKKVKESAASKAGGIFGKVTGIDTKTSKTEIELVMTLVKPDSTTPVTQNRVAQKYDGNASEAVKAAIDDAIGKILGKIED